MLNAFLTRILLIFQPDSDMDPSAGGEGASSTSSAVKRGLSVDSGQEVKRFRTATGAISAVRKNSGFVQRLRSFNLHCLCNLVFPVNVNVPELKAILLEILFIIFFLLFAFL